MKRMGYFAGMVAAAVVSLTVYASSAVLPVRIVAPQSRQRRLKRLRLNVLLAKRPLAIHARR